MSAPAASLDLIEGIVVGTMRLLNEEVAALRSYSGVDHADFTARKDMISFQLESLGRMTAGLTPSDRLRSLLSGLRQAVEENRALLEMHISATREIARIVSEVVRVAESDGTYTIEQSRRGKQS